MKSCGDCTHFSGNQIKHPISTGMFRCLVPLPASLAPELLMKPPIVRKDFGNWDYGERCKAFEQKKEPVG